MVKCSLSTAARPRRAIPLAALLAAFALSAVSRADDTDMERANQLLQEGQTLKRQGKVEQGCRKIEESVGVRRGYAAELELADCRAALGRPARAVQELSSIAARAAARSRADTANLSVYQEYIAYAERRIKALTPRLAGLPKVIIALSAEVAATPGLKVKLDGIPVEPVAVSTAVVVDAGHHLVRITAPGKRELTWEGDLTTGEKTASFDTLEDEPPPPMATAPVPPIPSAAPAASAAMATSVPPAVSPPPAPSDSSAPTTSDSAARNAGMVTGLVLAVAGAGVGVGLAVAAGDTRDEGLRLGCGEAPEPSECAALRSDYGALVTGEIIAFVGAGLGLGLAGVLFFTRPSSTKAPTVRATPVVGPKGAGLGVSGRF